MSYMTLGDGEMTVSVTSALQFNSTKYPGVCKPSNTATLQAFKNLQTQLNRVAQMKGYSKIPVDGDIGAGTVRLLSQVMGTSATLSCSAVASNAVVYANGAAGVAAAAGAPLTVPAPAPAKPPTLVLASGTEVPAPAPNIATSVLDSLSLMSTPMKVAGVGILAGIGYFAYKKWA